MSRRSACFRPVTSLAVAARRRRPVQVPAVVACVVVLAVAVLAADPAAGDQIAIQQVEALRYRAMVTGDLDVLDRLLADDLVYTHSYGGVDDKETFLAKLDDGRVDYKRLAVDGVRIRVWEDAAVVTGGVRMVVAAGGEDHDLDARFTAVYRFTDDRWQLVAWQSTRRQGEPAAAAEGASGGEAEAHPDGDGGGDAVQGGG
jgi:ketosteroid isomerase-like protein